MLKQAWGRGSPHRDRIRVFSPRKVLRMFRMGALTLSFLSLLVGGCSAPLKRDLTDCIRAEAGIGFGLHLEAQATEWLHPAVGLADVSFKPLQTIGWDPRPGQPVGRLRTAAFPAALLGYPFFRLSGTGEPWDDWNDDPGRILASSLILMGNDYISGESSSLFQLHRYFPNPLLVKAPSLEILTPSQQRSRDSWIGFSVTLGVLSLDFGINPLEILDMMGSALGWDILSDDGRITETPPIGTEG